MNIRKSLALVACFLLLAASFGAQANNSDKPSFEEIRKQQLELREEVQAGKGIFEDMNGPARAELAGWQSRLLAMIEGKADVSELGDEEQMEVVNLLQQINATINDVEGEQLVCEYTRRVGSHRKQKVCMTVAERRKQRMEAERDINRIRNGACVGGACRN